MALDPTVQRMTPKQRERLAFIFIGLLGTLLLAWGLYVYWLRPKRMEQELQRHRSGMSLLPPSPRTFATQRWQERTVDNMT
ncbi:MAG: hypothetical protein JST45_14915 [Bacteroidetes bacterium]|nr:hypothetical protein [Bacteroidota bacterium]